MAFSRQINLAKSHAGTHSKVAQGANGVCVSSDTLVQPWAEAQGAPGDLRFARAHLAARRHRVLPALHYLGHCRRRHDSVIALGAIESAAVSQSTVHSIVKL